MRRFYFQLVSKMLHIKILIWLDWRHGIFEILTFWPRVVLRPRSYKFKSCSSWDFVNFYDFHCVILYNHDSHWISIDTIVALEFRSLFCIYLANTYLMEFQFLRNISIVVLAFMLSFSKFISNRISIFRNYNLINL